MKDLHPMDKALAELGLTYKEVINSFRNTRKTHAQKHWARIRDAYDTGNIRLSTLRNIARMTGLTLGMFIDLVDSYAGIDYSDDEPPINKLESLKRMAENSKDLAFAYYRELLARNEADQELIEWAEENLT